MRSIKKEFVKFLDKKLLLNGLAQQAIEEKNARLLFYLACESCVGTNYDDVLMIKKSLEITGGTTRKEWGASFIQACIAYAEIKTGVESSIFPSEHSLTIWAKTPEEMRVKTTPLRGALVVWRNGSSQEGRIGAVSECSEIYCSAIEGNKDGNADPDLYFDGVHFTKRQSKSKTKLQIVGFLKPF